MKVQITIWEPAGNAVRCSFIGKITERCGNAVRVAAFDGGTQVSDREWFSPGKLVSIEPVKDKI